MKTKILLLLIVFGILGLVSCEKQSSGLASVCCENPYFPIDIGRSISYQIQEINIDQKSGVNDTIAYQIKELLESVIKQTDQYIDYRLERYYRETGSQPWKVINVWQIRKFDSRIHKIEENIEYVRLVTPLNQDLTWDGNKYNTQPDQIYNVKSIRDSLVLGENKSVLTVVHSSKESLIDKILEEEQYAKNIGLIFKQDIDVILSKDPSKPWRQKILKGNIYKQSVISQE